MYNGKPNKSTTVVNFVINRIEKALFLFGICSFVLAGCGTTAEIRMSNGLVLDGKIQRGDAEAIYIGDSNNRIPRNEIVDIDHPGNGAAITGICLFAYGILNGLIVMDESSSEEGSNVAIASTIGFSPALVGLGMAIWGGIVWFGSKGAVEEGRQDVSVAPLVVPSDDGTAYGGMMVLRF